MGVKPVKQRPRSPTLLASIARAPQAAGMPTRILLIAVTFMLGFPGIGHPQPVLHNLESSLEGAVLESMRTYRGGSGTARVRRCMECTGLMQLRITPRTRFTMNGAELPRDRALGREDSMVTLFHLPETGAISRIEFHGPRQ